MIPVSPDQFTAAVTGRLTLDVPSFVHDPFAAGGERGTDPGDPTINEGPPARPAAVLIPVVARPEATVLLTQRSSDLSNHSGQIAFPGGKIEPGDATPADTALREAEEEVGLNIGEVSPLGYLDPYLSATGFLVTPVVGLVSTGARVAPNPAEVADVFEVPLAWLMDPLRFAVHSRAWKGRMRYFYAIPFGERLIWGVTAGIVHNLYERLYR